MQVIYFEEDKKNQWNEFIAENYSESFLQSWEWGIFQKSLGRKIWRIGIIEGDDLFAVALVLKYNLPFGKSYLYCPRGPVIEKSKIKNQKSKILNFLFKEIEKISTREKSLFLKIDLPMELNNELGIINYEYPFNFKKSPNEIQPRNTLTLDLTKSEEQLLSEMKPKTRYNIKLAEKKGVRVFVANDYKKYFSELWKLIGETSKRNKIISHQKNYYFKMMGSLKENESGSKNELFSRLYLAEYNKKIIAANVVLFFGDLTVYLHGASSNDCRNMMAPYLLQWKQILDSKKAGRKIYDFWGITVKNEKPKWHGITRFKEGFGGHERSYIGAYDLVFDKFGYNVYKFFKYLRN